MSDICFEFLYSFDNQLLEECIEMEAYIRNGYYTDAIIESRVIAENTINKIAEMENIDFEEANATNQKEKITLLIRVNIINELTAKSFDSVRVFANNVAHGVYKSTLESALHVHRNIYNILTWYYERYSNDESFHKKPYDYDPFHMRKSINSMIESNMDEEDILENAFRFEVNEICKMINEKNGSNNLDNNNSIDNNKLIDERKNIVIDEKQDRKEFTPEEDLEDEEIIDGEGVNHMDDYEDEGLILDPIDFNALNKEKLEPADDSDLDKLKSMINKRFKNKDND